MLAQAERLVVIVRSETISYGSLKKMMADKKAKVIFYYAQVVLKVPQ